MKSDFFSFSEDMEEMVASAMDPHSDISDQRYLHQQVGTFILIVECSELEKIKGSECGEELRDDFQIIATY